MSLREGFTWGVALVSMMMITACTGPESSPEPAPPTVVATEPPPTVFDVPKPAAGSPPVGDQTDQWLSGVAVSGSTVVAVGTDNSANVSRPLFWASTDGGKRFRTAELINVQDPDSIPATGAHDVVAGRSGFVAYGHDGRARLWHSPDGLTWTTLEQDDAVFQSEDVIAEMIATDTGYLAFGVKDRSRGRGEERLVVWQSSDGLTWRRLNDNGISLGTYAGTAGLTAAVAHGQEVVIAADLEDPGDDDQPDRIAIWRSGDGGEAWSRIKTDPELGGGYRALPKSLQFQDGRFLLLAQGDGPDNDSWDGVLLDGGPHGERWRDRAQPIAWATDADESPTDVIKIGDDYLIIGHETPDRTVISLGPSLSHQTRIQHRSLTSDTGIAAAAGAEKFAIAVGHDSRSGSSEPAIWRIAGGKVTEPDVPVTGGQPPVEVAQLDRSVDGWQAIGTAADAPAVWTSRDGLDWESMPLDGSRKRGESTEIIDLAVDHRGRALAIGTRDRSPRGREALLWRRDPKGWAPIASKTFVSDVPNDYGFLDPQAIAGGGLGWVIAGTEFADGRTDLIIWSSRDEESWTEARGSVKAKSSSRDRRNRRTPWEEFRAPGGSSISIGSAVATAEGFVVVGTISEDGRDRPVMWSSTDGRIWHGPDALPLADGNPSSSPQRVLATYTHLIIEGRAGTQSFDQDAKQIVWSRPLSSDADWSLKLITDPAVDKVWFNDVIQVPGGVVGLGAARRDDQSDVRIWTSIDGTSWRPTPLELPRGSGPGDQALYTGSVDGDQLLLLATDMRSMGGGEYTVTIPLPRP